MFGERLEARILEPPRGHGDVAKLCIVRVKASTIRKHFVRKARVHESSMSSGPESNN